MSIMDIVKGALREPYPYNKETYNFPEAMQELGYNIKGSDTSVDGSTKVMLEMAQRIDTLEQELDRLQELVIHRVT